MSRATVLKPTPKGFVWGKEHYPPPKPVKVPKAVGIKQGKRPVDYEGGE